ncbi:MAG TPA: glycogen debranching N-terminal domain-containing protein [Kribbella sp.]|uniref:amylo-alpha-1,6-glucosidase n=1 Tax=Kribbella sp. TaxID=1871183 RepID=UPI002D79F790|nr:glycogen debranching N-terminal domain-containing protein [Kribbella sp.]HET6292186.1 glycogen debranching N-terminal domain-containing protein [Kribbella sp.]
MADVTQTVTEPMITLVEGTSFAISTTAGEMVGGGVHGLYHQDSRVVSGWQILLDGRPPEPLSAHLDTPYEATFLGRRRTDGARLLIERRRLIGDGMREDVVLRNLGNEDTACRLTVELASDFADMFSVKAGQPEAIGEVQWRTAGQDLLAEVRSPDRQRGIRVRLDGATTVSPGMLAVDVVVPAHDCWRGTVQIFPIVDDVESAPAYPRDEPVQDTQPAVRLRDWRQASPVVDLPDENFSAVLDRSIADLGALRIRTTDADGSELEVVAAGAPWYMTLFGRDSLLTAWMALPIDHELALSTLHALASLQGRRVNPLNEEEPGRILHEVRHGSSFPLSPGNAVYYGTADATPLFCMLVGELHRWGVPKERLAPLMPHVDRALAWILEYGDRDGDGFVEYKRATDRGLLNQGWKDSYDSIVFADGTLADAPIALAEVQAYVYGAFVARSELAATFDGPEVAREWAERAAKLKTRFHQAFWLPDRGYFALALDAGKRPVDALASNMGHCLWTGLVDESVVDQVAKHLLSPEMFSGWGIRTLATSTASYDPVSYHNGSIWPHDSALCAAGLARYGFTEEANRVARGIFDAAVAFGGRLPELFCGFDRGEYPYPVAYPTSCSPQAWAAAAPFLLLRAVLGFDPDLPDAKVYLEPGKLPEEFGDVEVRNLPLAGRRVAVSGAAAGEVRDLPGIEVVRRRRNPLTDNQR